MSSNLSNSRLQDAPSWFRAKELSFLRAFLHQVEDSLLGKDDARMPLRVAKAFFHPVTHSLTNSTTFSIPTGLSTDIDTSTKKHMVAPADVHRWGLVLDVPWTKLHQRLAFGFQWVATALF